MRAMQRQWSLIVMTTAVAAATPVEAQRTTAPAGRLPLATIDAYVTQQMKAWKVPGLALAIVHNDSIVLAKGYGVRTAGRAEPVDDRTLFAIGSSSKAFTAALVAMAVDEGKMQWDERVQTYLPGYQLHDGYAGRDLTLRDALSHRSGLARGDLMWYVGGFDREEILRRTRHLKPSWGFRSRFGYQNLMYLAAGEAVARVQGASWDALVKTRIFAPLGMQASVTSVADLPSGGNVASPHAEDGDSVRVMAWKNIDNIAPAGSINSSARDMAQWVRMQLGEGTFAGRQVVSPANLREMWQPNIPLRLTSGIDRIGTPNANIASYGLGWFLQDFNGRLAVHHGGNIDGFSATVAMLPEEKLGVVILTNMNGTVLRDFLWAWIFDAYTRGTPRDFGIGYRALVDTLQQRAREAEAAADRGRVAGTSPSLSPERYAGVYSDSMYGDVSVTADGNALRVRFGIAEGRLEHWHYDTFRAVMDNPQFGRPFVRFTLNMQGSVSRLALSMVPETEFTFRPPAAGASARGAPPGRQ